jgi:mono/diheme cytochrome c family protein
MDPTLQLASSGAGFFDATFLYISAGLLIATALGVALLGMRKPDFPSRNQLRGLGAIAVVLVVCTGAGAILDARFEQAERTEENREAAQEADEQTEAKEEAEAPLTEGKAAEPDTSTGEASSPPEDAGAADAEGMPVFVEAGCGGCHTLADAGSTGQIGPELDQVLPGQSADQVKTSIVDPGAKISEGFADGTMPANYAEQFTDAELDALAAYLSAVAGS